MLILLEPEKHISRGATIRYDSNFNCYWMSVTSKYGGHYGDSYKSEEAAKRDFGRKFSKGAKWNRVEDPF